MIPTTIKTLCNNIICVYSKIDKKVYYDGKFFPILFKNKYSSSIVDTIRIKNNEDILPIKDMLVKYKCPTCESEHTILLKKFLYKNTTKCRKCSEDFEKRKNQSNYLTKSFADFGKIVKMNIDKIEISIEDIINNSLFEFKNETKDFKDRYFIKVPTIEEFNLIKNKIKIDNINMDKIIYYPYIKTNHSHKYSPKILYNNKFYLLYNIKYKCESCELEFNGRDIKKRCNQYKILCRKCTMCNKTFKIRHTKNIKGDIIRYQSSPEIDLINFCKTNSILIENGPSIDYIFNNKKHKYYVDFKIKNILIEIKDNHIWHRNEIESGKWKCKEKAALEYCEENDLVYKLIMKEDVVSIKNYILRYFWFIKKF